MTPPNELLFTLFSAALGVVIAGCTLKASRQAWRRHQRPQDMAMQVTASIWLLYLVSVTSLQVAASAKPMLLMVANYVAHLGLQAMVVSVGYLLLSLSGVTRSGVYLVLAALAFLGLGALHWQPWLMAGTFTNFPASAVYSVWITINLLAIALVTLAVAVQVKKTDSMAAWLSLGACFTGLGLCAEQLPVASEAQSQSLLAQPIYALFVVVVWWVTGRAETRVARHGQTGFAADFPRSANMELLSDFGPSPDLAALAVAHERRRIGQDLHDGVASQLVNILSSLDIKTPEQHAIAMAIEQCLVDLKLTVDALDSANDNVLDALGRLRYRVQHSLDKLGIRMSWRVEMRDELEAVRGEAAQHTLRIAQEAVANVMLHARASAIEVVCRFVPESTMMVLEVRDNGRGIPRRKDERPVEAGGPRSGKGLAGMRHRAKTLGAELSVSSKLGAGTRVRLMLPLADLLEAHRQDEDFPNTRPVISGLAHPKNTTTATAAARQSPPRTSGASQAV